MTHIDDAYRPTHTPKPELSLGARISIATIAVAGGLAALKGFQNASQPNAQPVRSVDDRNVCEPRGSQHFDFGGKFGINDAVYAINGGGRGEGDPCWSESVAAVEQAVGSGSPRADQEVQIPQEMVIVHTDKK